VAKQLSRRVAANEFSPAFQGRSGDVASATMKIACFSRRLRDAYLWMQFFPALKGRAKFNSPLRGDSAESL